MDTIQELENLAEKVYNGLAGTHYIALPSTHAQGRAAILDALTAVRGAERENIQSAIKQAEQLLFGARVPEKNLDFIVDNGRVHVFVLGERHECGFTNCPCRYAAIREGDE